MFSDPQVYVLALLGALCIGLSKAGFSGISLVAVVIFADINATIGYCPYTEEGAVEYIFVSRSCRHRGYAKQLLKLVEKSVQCKLSFQMPVSTLGEKLRASHDQSARLNLDPGTPDSYMNPNSISE